MGGGSPLKAAPQGAPKEKKFSLTSPYRWQEEKPINPRRPRKPGEGDAAEGPGAGATLVPKRRKEARPPAVVIS